MCVCVCVCGTATEQAWAHVCQVGTAIQTPPMEGSPVPAMCLCPSLSCIPPPSLSLVCRSQRTAAMEEVAAPAPRPPPRYNGVSILQKEKDMAEIEAQKLARHLLMPHKDEEGQGVGK